jgi:hypothetical protein
VTAADDQIAFVRARLIERSAERNSLHRGWCDNPTACGHDSCNCGYPEQVHAETEASRALLEEVIRPYLGAETTTGRVAAVALRLHALPYANHPDYQPEWRLDAD